MKKVLVFSCAALMVLFIHVNAQPPQPPSPEEMAKMETESMKAGLNLTADQLTRVQAINLKYAQKMGEMFSQGPGGDFAEMQKKMEVIQGQKRTEFEKVLSAGQLKKYDEMVADRRKNMPGPPM